MRLVFFIFSVRVERDITGLEPIAEIQAILVFHFLSAIFATLSRHPGIKVSAHLTNMQVVLALGTLILAREWQ